MVDEGSGNGTQGSGVPALQFKLDIKELGRVGMIVVVPIAQMDTIAAIVRAGKLNGAGMISAALQFVRVVGIEIALDVQPEHPEAHIQIARALPKD